MPVSEKPRKKSNNVQLIKGERIAFKRPTLKAKIEDFFAELKSYAVKGYKYIKHQVSVKETPAFEWNYIGRMKPIGEGFYTREEILARG